LKNNKPTDAEFEVFADECVANLPDGLTRRQICLKCLLASLPRRHSRIQEVAKLLYQLDSHQQSQAEFRFQTSTLNPTQP